MEVRLARRQSYDPPHELTSVTSPHTPNLMPIKRLWSIYLMEAIGLAVFMTFASAFTVLLFHPDSSVGKAIGEPAARFAVLGVCMFPVVLFGIIKAPWGKKSGAHINPAVTLAFWRLGKISAVDAAFYILFQFLGAIATVWIVAQIMGPLYSHPEIDFAANKPGPDGPAVAFAIEFVITFGLMMLLLWMSNDERLEPKLPLFVSLLIGFYLTTATPFTGMSLNPARTTGSAVWASERPGLWLYFVAPIAATLCAAELYRRVWPDRLGGKSYPPPPPSPAEAESS